MTTTRPQLQPEFEEAIWHLQNGDGILFAGAGLSLGARNLRNQDFKTAGEFANALGTDLGLPSGTPLSLVADEFAATRGDDLLITELNQEFSTRDVQPYHIRIATLPWRRIYTTNYDNVLETAASRIGRKLVTVTTRDSVTRLAKHDTLCVHLNGSIDRLNRDTVQTELKLTDRSYLTESLPDSPWAVMFRQDIAVARAVIFVGYGLSDIDVTRLLVDSADLKRKCFFVLPPTSPPATIRRAERIGTVVPLTAAEFARAVEERRSIAPAETSISFTCFRKYEPDASQPSSVTDEKVFELFMWGRIDDAAVWSSMHGDGGYVQERRGTADAQQRLVEPPRVAVLHSHLGNGKTAALRVLLARCRESGLDIFEVTGRTPELLREAAAILRRSNRTIVVIDDYPSWLDLIRYIASNAGDHISMLLTARTPAHDVLLDDLSAAVQSDAIPEFSVDRLDDNEVEWFIDVLDQHGLWGQQSAVPLRTKRNIIIHDCGRQVNAVLLRIFESPQILARFDTLLTVLREKKDYYEVVAAILVLNVLHQSSSLNVLADLTEKNVISDTRFRQNEVVRQMLDFERGEIVARSSVAAQYLLRRLADASLISDVIGRLARRADRAAAAAAQYRGVLKELMRFSNLKILLGRDDSGPAALRLYESIKHLHGCRNNPSFWLQYAIAALFTGDLTRADKYFETAYAFARQYKVTYGDYDTYQIDNHYARHLLVTAVERQDAAMVMQYFRRARKILTQQLKSERLHYPYRVARLYYDLYVAFEDDLSEGDVAEIARAAQFVLSQSNKLPPERHRHKYVKECREGMEYIISSFASKRPAGLQD
jgi:hypothetical protein